MATETAWRTDAASGWLVRPSAEGGWYAMAGAVIGWGNSREAALARLASKLAPDIDDDEGDSR